jgi:hypothetical protein
VRGAVRGEKEVALHWLAIKPEQKNKERGRKWGLKKGEK